ncbi:hypothetical protein L6164_034862 [Bauhinia variegata]|uniref:Uncharacterized protein n=1 Tax=Bauhinia variegata TaxID=167791 RepID=A0ACB9KVW2_BAUVA|nr:hypothetical protein L6164_034862 [Bauhinia variegata]
MGRASSSSSSSISSTNQNASSLTHQNSGLPTDLRLGLSIFAPQQAVGHSLSRGEASDLAPTQQPFAAAEAYDCNDNHSSFFVKVYMEGIPIGRKLDVLAHDGYPELVKTLEHMFDTTILWGTEMDGVQSDRCHVLTYEDEEGDFLMVGDVPWEMFLSTVKRLKITRIETFRC